MSGTDNWVKLYRWWQEHLKSRINSSAIITDHQILDNRPSVTSVRSMKTPQIKKMKKRASYGEIDECQVGYNDFRHVRDSIRGKNPRTTRVIPTITNNKSLLIIDEHYHVRCAYQQKHDNQKCIHLIKQLLGKIVYRLLLVSFSDMHNNTKTRLSFESEYKMKRHTSLTRFHYRRRQMMDSTEQLNITRRPFRRSTTCDISSEENLSNENKNIQSKLTSMNKIRNNNSRRLSLVKFELPSMNSNGIKDEQKSTMTSCSPNLIQKLFFRQFSPKTRPYLRGISSDDNVSITTTVLNETPPNRRRPSALTIKQSCISLSSSNSSKQNVCHGGENLLIPSCNKALSKSQQSDLNFYLSKRRNTTGSISLTKLVDLKNVSNGNTLKITTAMTTFNNSNSKISTENIFQTVEDSDFLGMKQLIQTNENIVNSYNEYDWCPLDIAIMLNNIPMIRLLLHYGAEESLRIQPEECRYQSVCQQLAILNERNLDEPVKKSSANRLAPDDIQSRRLSPSCDKQQRHRRASKSQQQQLNQHRSLMLSQMKDNYDQAGIPDAPTNVRLMVTGSDNITVTFDEPLRSNGVMVIKYKIEWSIDEYFNDVSFDIIKNCFLREYIIRNLPVGQKCYVRVSAGNMKGFGQTVIANPPYCVPSNWREFSNTSRTNICDLRFEEILNRILIEREGNGINRSLEGNESSETSNLRSRRRSYGNLRKNIRQLFQLYPRLARSMKRGLYLVSVMLNGDRILVTNEDVLPMVEVDENYGHNLLADFQWFMKLTFVWDDLKSLRPDLERCLSVTSFYLRIKLVQAAIELQTLEEINNLGRLHHTYIRDNDGNVAFVLINDLSSDTRANICPSNLKWTTITKFFETIKEFSSLKTNSCLQQIIEKLPDMIDFYHASLRHLDSGLYVAYLKMQNSVDSVRVMVNKSIPGSLPCTKIRAVANVSRSEWEWLHNNHNESTTDDEYSDNSLDLFKRQFRNAAKELFVILNLPETHFSNSRIYDSQVVEIRDDLSLIILMSTADEVNILSTPSNHSLTSFIYLPVYIFEVLQHLSNNYRFICQYSRVSICLDFELICAQQNQREAFSINELDETRYRLNHLLSCQQDLDDIWRLSRWLVHVINCAKDKTYSGISLKSFQSTSNFNPIKNDQLYSMKKSDSGFIDIEDHSIELTFYITLLTSNTYIPFKIRLNKITKLNEILQMILTQEQGNFCKLNSSVNFVWIRSNGREYILEENVTAYDIQKRLAHFGGQIYLRSKDLLLLHSSQPIEKTSWLFPPTSETNSTGPGSNLSLNI